MYMAIAIFFILVITAMIVYGSHYECEHFDGNHKPKKNRKKSLGR